MYLLRHVPRKHVHRLRRLIGPRISPGLGYAARAICQTCSVTPPGQKTQVTPMAATSWQLYGSLSKNIISSSLQPSRWAIRLRCPCLFPLRISHTDMSATSCNFLPDFPRLNLARHSRAQAGSSQHEATATVVSDHLGSSASSFITEHTPEWSVTYSPRLSLSRPSGCTSKGAPPPQSSYMSGYQRQPSRSKTTHLGRAGRARR
mmetsp:Transcript_12965/g.29472  ORF Transcript_12965/g.29472 Transcript_12965/m.29472 type:complete len:204 (-) Transcript_12965:287-898(-)